MLRGYIVHTIKNKLENYEERGDGGQTQSLNLRLPMPYNGGSRIKNKHA